MNYSKRISYLITWVICALELYSSNILEQQNCYVLHRAKNWLNDPPHSSVSICQHNSISAHRPPPNWYIYIHKYQSQYLYSLSSSHIYWIIPNIIIILIENTIFLLSNYIFTQMLKKDRTWRIIFSNTRIITDPATFKSIKKKGRAYVVNRASLKRADKFECLHQWIQNVWAFIPKMAAKRTLIDASILLLSRKNSMNENLCHSNMISKIWKGRNHLFRYFVLWMSW